MINLKPIGYIETPYIDTAPNQPIDNDEGQFCLNIKKEYESALAYLEEFKYIYVLFYLNQVRPETDVRQTIEKRENKEIGLFATRTPNRPNPIGLSIVKIIRIEGNLIYISGIDALNETPILDIKPYIRGLDDKEDPDLGWIDKDGAEYKERQNNNIYLYTDGACSGNPGPGGYAALIRKGSDEFEVCGYEPETTNNRMELMAVIEGLKEIERNSFIKVVSDSNYVIQGITEWLQGWKKKGWKTSSNRPVKNKDLWQELDSLSSNYKIEFIKVKGHSGHELNERVDTLAREQIELNKEKG